MFDAKVYIQRRQTLRKQVPSGLLIFPGNEESAMNYVANAYPFRQDSTFLYFFGLDSPGLAAAVDIDQGQDILFGDDIGLEDIIWMGNLPLINDRALSVGVTKVMPRAKFDETVRAAVSAGRPVHFLPPYRPETAALLGDLLGIPGKELKAKASLELVKATIAQRSVKTREEVAEMEKAVDVTYEMYRLAMKLAKPGRFEYDISAAMEGAARTGGGQPAFPFIVTVNGHIFHNHYHGNMLKKGRLLVADTGAESEMHYAADITRTIPVGGRFNQRQKDIYEIVLETQLKAIRAIKPGVMYKDVHLQAAKTIASGLKDLGLMKGDIESAIAQGAHALFFPHGLGHMIGLDVHDMENLGENHIGYDDKVQRSDQFGLAYLRLAKALQPGFVLTVEPGIYFIPALYENWKKEKKGLDFIDYAKVEKYLDFGGVRIEDNVLVTGNGRRVLGRPIPKTVAEVEKAAHS